MKIAAVDIGTNAVKSKIFKTTPTSIEFIHSIRSPIRLGTEVFLQGKIPKKKLNELTVILKNYIHYFAKKKVKHFEIVATSAFRDTLNSENSRRYIEQNINCPVRIISGFEESSLLRFHPDISTNKRSFYVDVGGGSTEIFQYNKKGSLIQSFQLGAVRNLHKKDKQKEWRRLKDWIISTNLNSHLIGIGGNVRSFFKCQKEDEMNQEIFLLNIKNLRALSVKDKIERYKFSKDRADVIDEALKIFKKIVTLSSPQKITATKWGVADSIAVKLFHEIYSTSIEIKN